MNSIVRGIVERPRQVGEENKRAFQDADQDHFAFVGIVAGNLGSQFFDAPPNLFLGDQRSRGRWFQWHISAVRNAVR